MNPKTDLDRVDRATLRAWRIANVLGWGFLALIAGLALGWVAMNAAFATGFKLTTTTVGPAVFGVVFASLVGAAIGAIVLHVYRWPGMTAGLARSCRPGSSPSWGVRSGRSARRSWPDRS